MKEPKLKVIRRRVSDLTKGQCIVLNDPLKDVRVIGYVESIGHKYITIKCRSNIHSTQCCEIVFSSDSVNKYKEVLLILNVSDWLIYSVSTRPLPKPTIVLSKEL